MRVTVLAFASISDLVGRQPVELELKADAKGRSTIADLKQALEVQFDGLAAHWNGLAVAIDGELVDDSAVLREGNEVALLPPVSGGCPSRSHLTRETLDAGAVAGAVQGSGQGAVVVFLGDVRNHHAGRGVAGITYTAYESMAERRLAAICRELQEAEMRDNQNGCLVEIVHRLGRLKVGETSVVIAVSSPHRAAAYELSRLALERLKAEVPIWKEEHYSDGDSQWREEESLSQGPTTA